MAMLVLAAGALFTFRRHERLVAPHLGAPLDGPAVASPPAPSAAAPVRVWIETDAGCGLGRHVDVDDCYALATALAAPADGSHPLSVPRPGGREGERSPSRRWGACPPRCRRRR